MKTHTLKCWPVYYEEVVSGRKKFETRENDRDFQPGDAVILREWDPETETFTGRYSGHTIGYMTTSGDLKGALGLKPNWCSWSIENLIVMSV